MGRKATSGRVERNGGERADGETRRAVAVHSGHHGDAGRKATEALAEMGWIVRRWSFTHAAGVVATAADGSGRRKARRRPSVAAMTVGLSHRRRFGPHRAGDPSRCRCSGSWWNRRHESTSAGRRPRRRSESSNVPRWPSRRTLRRCTGCRWDQQIVCRRSTPAPPGRRSWHQVRVADDRQRRRSRQRSEVMR